MRLFFSLITLTKSSADTFDGRGGGGGGGGGGGERIGASSVPLLSTDGFDKEGIVGEVSGGVQDMKTK